MMISSPNWDVLNGLYLGNGWTDVGQTMVFLAARRTVRHVSSFNRLEVRVCDREPMRYLVIRLIFKGKTVSYEKFSRIQIPQNRLSYYLVYLACISWFIYFETHRPYHVSLQYGSVQNI